MKLGCTNAAILSLSFVTYVSCRHSTFSSLSTQRHQHAITSHGWIPSHSAQTRYESDIPSWFTALRGGSVATPSTEPEVAPVDGTIQSLYLPGLLDISINRPNMVSIFIMACLFLFIDSICSIYIPINSFT